jgi:hypothetical protein
VVRLPHESPFNLQEFSVFFSLDSAVVFNRPKNGIPKFHTPIQYVLMDWRPAVHIAPSDTFPSDAYEIAMGVAGFTHGSAHRNPFTTDNLSRTRRRLQCKNIPCQVGSLCLTANIRVGKLNFHGECEKILLISAFRLSVYSFVIHQDMAPQIPSTSVDT